VALTARGTITVTGFQLHIFFVPFFTTKKGGSGTGLGLAISHPIITERHHGKIDFDTGPDGTRFYVRLPFESTAHA
jgi:signal transduction histidine kinase